MAPYNLPADLRRPPYSSTSSLKLPISFATPTLCDNYPADLGLLKKYLPDWLYSKLHFCTILKLFIASASPPNPQGCNLPLRIAGFPVIPLPVSPIVPSPNPARQRDRLYCRSYKADSPWRVLRDDYITIRFMDIFPQAEGGCFLYDNTLIVFMAQEFRNGIMETYFPATFSGFQLRFAEPSSLRRYTKPRVDPAEYPSVIGMGTRVRPVRGNKDCETSLGLMIDIQGHRYLTTSQRGALEYLQKHDTGARKTLQLSCYEKCRTEEEIKGTVLEVVKTGKRVRIPVFG